MSKTILIVDDDHGIVNLISAMMKRTGYTIVPAYSGQEALDKHAAMDNLDLILLDLAMPDIDGYTVLRKIRQREETPGISRIPIIVLTAYVKTALNGSDLYQHVDGVITKPIITAQKLLDELAKALDEKA